jgi:hypothetical protein
MTRKALPCALFIAAFAAIAASAGAAEKRVADPGKKPVSETCPADDRVAASPGLRAFIDPQTGQLREPTPEEAQALVHAAREELVQELEALEAVVHPDGMISLDLKGHFMQDVVVVKRPDGSLSMQCVPDSEGARVSHPAAPAKPAPPLEER